MSTTGLSKIDTVCRGRSRAFLFKLAHLGIIAFPAVRISENWVWTRLPTPDLVSSKRSKAGQLEVPAIGTSGQKQV